MKAISGYLTKQDAAIEILKSNQNKIIENLYEEIFLTYKLLTNKSQSFSVIINDQKIIVKNGS